VVWYLSAIVSGTTPPNLSDQCGVGHPVVQSIVTVTALDLDGLSPASPG
jgi:hypothetical protein